MRKLCPSVNVARMSRKQNTGHIPGKKSAANKRVYTVINSGQQWNTSSSHWSRGSFSTVHFFLRKSLSKNFGISLIISEKLVDKSHFIPFAFSARNSQITLTFLKFNDVKAKYKNPTWYQVVNRLKPKLIANDLYSKMGWFDSISWLVPISAMLRGGSSQQGYGGDFRNIW